MSQGEKVFGPVRFWWYMTSKLGLRPTRFRFQIPAAENAASYHFEAMAPAGVRIVKASLLAGRPHEPDRHVSADRIVSHKPTVGLHAVEIPNNSLCRVQLDLRVPARGWLTQLVTSCGLILAVLAVLVRYWPDDTSPWNADQITNVIVILVAASAATATLVAQRDFPHGLGAFMVTWLRAIGVMSLLLPIVAAGYLVYEMTQPSREAMQGIYRAMLFLCLFALILFLIPLLGAHTKFV